MCSIAHVHCTVLSLVVNLWTWGKDRGGLGVFGG